MVLFSGKTGDGKSLLLNWLVSKGCYPDPTGKRWKCDNEVVVVGESFTESETEHIKVIFLNETESEILGSHVVFADSPGFYDKRRNQTLVQLLNSLVGSTAIHDLQLNPHVNIFVIGFPGLQDAYGETVERIRKFVEAPGEDAKLLVTTKVPLKKDIENSGDPGKENDSKKGIEEKFRGVGYTDSSIQKHVSYDPKERDIASSCIFSSGRYLCEGNGGRNRTQFFQLLKREIASARPTNPQYMIDDALARNLEVVEEDLETAVDESFESDHSSSYFFEIINDTYGIFEPFLDIGHPSLDDIKERVVNYTRSRIEKIGNDTVKILDPMLIVGNLSHVDGFFSDIIKLNGSKAIYFFPPSIVDGTLKTIFETAIERSIAHLNSTLQETALLRSASAAAKVNATFLLVNGTDSFVNQTFPKIDLNHSYTRRFKPVIDAHVNRSVLEFYQFLGSCQFSEAEVTRNTVQDTLALLGNGSYVYEYPIKDYASLSISYGQLATNDKCITVALDGLATVASLAITIYSGKILVKGVFNLVQTVSSNPQAVLGLVGSGISALGMGNKTRTDYQSYTPTDAVCHAAWLEQKFYEGIPDEFLPSWFVAFSKINPELAKTWFENFQDQGSSVCSTTVSGITNFKSWIPGLK